MPTGIRTFVQNLKIFTTMHPSSQTYPDQLIWQIKSIKSPLLRMNMNTEVSQYWNSSEKDTMKILISSCLFGSGGGETST